MKILYITEFFPDPRLGIGVWGGGEKQFYEISKRLAARGHDVTVLSIRLPGQSEEDIVDDIKIYRVGLSRNPKTGEARKRFLPIISYVLNTAKQAIQTAPNLIHCNTYFPVFSGKLASRQNRIPLVSTFHDIYGLKGWIESQQSFVFGSLGHLVTTLATKLSHDRIITVSPQSKRKLMACGVPGERITIVPNGVDLKLFDSINVKKVPKQILYVGRLVGFKHVDWLIRAFNEVLKEEPEARLKVVGYGPEWRHLHELVRKFHLRENVTFTGTISTYEAVARVFKESSIFVLPSVIEGEAIVLKEAMAASLPILAMRVSSSGVLSLIRNGENGFLIEPGKPNFIAERIIEILQNEDERKKMGMNGKNFVEKFDWDVIADRTLRVYHQILEY